MVFSTNFISTPQGGFLSGIDLKKAIGFDHCGLKWGMFFTLACVGYFVYKKLVFPPSHMLKQMEGNSG